MEGETARGANGFGPLYRSFAALVVKADQTTVAGAFRVKRERFLLPLTVAVAIITGIALFSIAARGAWALSVYIQRGEAGGALTVGALSLAAFLLCLLFMLPSALRQIIELGGKPGNRGPIAFGASIVLFAVLLAAAGVERQPGNLVFGLLPRAIFYAIVLTFSALFLVLFIYPGFAYPVRQRQDSPAVAGPKPRLVQGLYHIKSPWLRGVIKATIGVHLVIWGFAFYTFQFAQVIPEPAIVEANRGYLVLTYLLSLLPLGAFFAAAPISDGKTSMDHVRAKWPLILGIGLFNGFAVIDLPERGLPIVANAVLGAKPEIRSYKVISAKPRSGLRGCGAKVVILLNPETGRSYDLCRVPTEIAERARSGDMLDVLGKSAGFGMTIQRFQLRQVQAGASFTPDRFAMLER